MRNKYNTQSETIFKEEIEQIYSETINQLAHKFLPVIEEHHLQEVYGEVLDNLIFFENQEKMFYDKLFEYTKINRIRKYVTLDDINIFIEEIKDEISSAAYDRLLEYYEIIC